MAARPRDSTGRQGLRILAITELFLPTKGGTAVWFDEVYRRLGGKQIHVVTADVPGADEHDREHPNTVHRVRLVRHRWLRPESAAMYVKLLIRSLTLACRYRFEAVHAGRVLPEGLVGLVTARLARVPLLVYAHGEEITTWTQRAKMRVMREVYRRADVIVANSQFTRSELLRLGVSPQRITIVSPGVDVQRFRPGLEVRDLAGSLGLSNGQKLVLSVGRLSRRKGFDQTIRAVARLRAEGMDVHYALIGIGEDFEYLGAIARECGVGSSVHLIGHVLPGELPRWYNAADVFAMPNREIDGDNEGFGMVFLEAAACGRPVVAGRDGGTADAVEDGVTGFRVDGSSVTEIVAALRAVLGDAVLASALGERGRARAMDRFDWERVAQKTRALCRGAREAEAIA